MSQHICPNCGKPSSESQFCLYCGMPLTPEARGSPRQREIARKSQEDFTVAKCTLLCLCLTPIGALIYYLIAKSD